MAAKVKAFALFLATLSLASGQGDLSNSQQLSPIIVSVSPNFGSVEGGTDIVITGSNFQSGGMFTSHQVFVGGGLCEINDYYTTNERIICKTPKCYAPACLVNSYSSFADVQVSVLVSTVQGILEDTSTFRYHSFFTPMIYKITSDSTWGGDTSTMYARIQSELLGDLDIKLGSHHANLGDNDELNPSVFSDRWSKFVQYRTPDDMEAGHYNVSLSVQSVESTAGSRGSGLARTFENGKYDFGVDNYFDFYNYRSTLAGTVHSTTVFPSVRSVSPRGGSIGGGTVLTITGSGFSRDSEEMQVFAGGVPCDILTSDLSTITCRTRAHSIAENKTALKTLMNVSGSVTAASTHVSGSPGWWVKIWGYPEFIANNLVHQSARLSFGWRERGYVSLYRTYGWNWYSELSWPNGYYFVMDAATEFFAPYTGYYTFLLSTDDTGFLYASRDGVSVKESLIAQCPTFKIDGNYYGDERQISSQILLEKGESLFLRVRNTNGGGIDHFSVAVEITPLYNANGELADNVGEVSNHPDSALEAMATETFPERLLYHHAKREVQEFTISYTYNRAVQLVNITGLSDTTTGDFKLVVQNSQQTERISLSSTNSEISTALYSAAIKLPKYVSVECYYFTVWRVVRNNYVELYVRCEADVETFSALSIVDFSLKGTRKSNRVSLVIAHSPIPTGTFVVTVGGLSSAPIRYDASSTDLELAIKSINPSNIEVEIYSTGHAMNSRFWRVTFKRPSGPQGLIQVDTTGIVTGGDPLRLSQKIIRNGAISTLFFDPIPPYMTATPVSWATGGATTSFVEVLKSASVVGSDMKDVVKSVCAATHQKTGNASDYMFVNGDESNCAFEYTSASSAVVTNQVMTYIDDYNVNVVIRGYDFDLSNYTKLGGKVLSVKVGPKSCNITSFSDTSIECTVGEVPWGDYDVNVYLEGYGAAVILAVDQLTFTQEIFSVSENHGSFLGGQRLVITGRGFRSFDAEVLIGTEVCKITHASYDRVSCVVPRANPESAYNRRLSTATKKYNQIKSERTTAKPLAESEAVENERRKHLKNMMNQRDATRHRKTVQRFADEAATIRGDGDVHSLNLAAHRENVHYGSYPKHQRLVDDPYVNSMEETDSTLDDFVFTGSKSKSYGKYNHIKVEVFEDEVAAPDLSQIEANSEALQIHTIPCTFSPSRIARRAANNGVLSDTLSTVDIFSDSYSALDIFSDSYSSDDEFSFSASMEYSVDFSEYSAGYSEEPEPSGIPTTIPTAMPSLPLNYSTVEVTVDGMAAESFYTYSIEFTPYLTSISPMMVSRASEVNLTFSGIGLYSNEPGNVEVTFGGEICNVYKVGDDMVMCTLPQGVLLDVFNAEVVIYIPNVGYVAKSDEAMLSFPSVMSGFEIFSISPQTGSLRGGTTIEITGFGFISTDGEDYKIKFAVDAAELPSEYNVLSSALGFSVDDSETLYCLVSEVSFSRIICSLDKTPKGVLVKDFSVAMGLNGVATACKEDVCLFSQSHVVTPMLMSVSDVSINESGYVFFNLDGTLLATDGVVAVHLSKIIVDAKSADSSTTHGHRRLQTITGMDLDPYMYHDTMQPTLGHSKNHLLTVGDIPCWSEIEDDDSVAVVCPPVTAGRWNITAFVASLGWADSNGVTVLTDIEVTDVEMDSSTGFGSIAGGVVTTIRGYGFSNDCRENSGEFEVLNNAKTQTFSAKLSHHAGALHHFMDFISCTVTEMIVFTPSIVPLIPANEALLTSSTSYMYEVKSVTISVNALDDSTDVDFTSTFTMNSNFKYSTEYTPTGIVTIRHGTKSSVSDYFVNITCPTMLHPARSISFTRPADGGVSMSIHDCTPVSTVKTGRFLSGGILQYRAELSCPLPLLRASNYQVVVVMADCGRAHWGSNTPLEFKSDFIVHGMLNPMLTDFPQSLPNRFLTVSTVSRIESSIAGGQIVTISGEGLSDEVAVSMCSQSCTYVNSTYDSYQCIAPDHLTIKSLVDTERILSLMPNVNWAFDDLVMEVPGVPFSSSTSITSRAFDDGFETFFSHGISNCFVGIAAQPGSRIRPHNLHFYPRLQHAYTIKNTRAVFEGSLDNGATYIKLADIGSAREGWNTVKPADDTVAKQWFTHLRYREPTRVSPSACLLAEMWFEGISASVQDTCNVIISRPLDPTSPAPVTIGTINYNLTHATPIIFSLTPSNGTALGGTEVKINGINLMSTSEWPTVAFNGIPCDVSSASPTSILCVTRSRLAEEVNPYSIDVNVPGLGYAVSPDPSLKFMYIDRWSAATSWRNQKFPKAGDIVWIPEGQVIMLDVFTPTFLFVLVQGHLYFDRDRDVSLDSTYIFVYGGYMEVGTAEAPYERNAVITLHGDRFTDIDMPMFGAKCLVVSALGFGSHAHTYNPRPHQPGPDMGQLEIHGLKRLRTWTKLAVTAYAGDNFVVTAEPVDFKAGETVVVPGTELPGGDDPSRPEYGIDVMIVLSNDDNHHVYFTEPLKYTHRSEIVIEEGRSIDLRCEIGLLTRNVVIRGDDRSAGQLFGVHVVGMMRSIFRIENAEVTLCGQAHNLGRYCTHSHVGMNMAGSYVKANSIHHSFQRTVTTHSTHHWEVRDNVGYDVLGHAYFVEFGDETYNQITGNLGIFIKPNSAGLPSDHKPSVFWTANPTNFWSDNVGVHSRAWGFWFELPGPKGDKCPFQAPLGEFHNMTFRSNSAIGLRIYPGWTPQVDPCGPNTAPAPQYLRNMVSYRNGNLGLFTKKMGDLHHIGHSILENGGSEIHIVKFEHVPYDYNPHFLDILLIGTLNPPNNDDFNLGGFGIHAPQQDFFYVKNITFKNYGRTPAFGTCNACESGENFNQGGVQYRTEQLKFIRSKRRIQWMPHYKEIFRDMDGTLVDGPAESYVVRRYFFNDWPGVCSAMDTSIFDYSTVCNQPVRTMRVDDVEPKQLDFTDLRITSSVGSDEVYFLPLHFYGWTVPLVVNQQYNLEWKDSQTSARELSLGFGGKNEYLNEAVDKYGRNESARIVYTPYHYDYDAYSFKVTYGSKITVANVSVDVPAIPHFRMAATSYVNETLKLDLSTAGSDRSLGWRTYRVNAVPQLCPPAGCPVPPVYVPPSEFVLWTNASIWPGAVLPKAGDDVVISSDKWVVLNINPPPFKSVTVNGKISFQKGRGPKSNITLSTGNLIIYGEFQIDFTNSTADGVADVILTGDKASSNPVLIGEGIFPGSKVIAVPGSLKLVGEKVENTWFRLAATANFGDSVIFLNGLAQGWRVGDLISLSPTSYFTRNGDAWYDSDAGSASGMDKRTISSIYINYGTGITTIQLASPLGATHLCISDIGESFCGTVGLLSRNVRLSSRNSEDPLSESFGFGGHIMVMDATIADNAVGRDMMGKANLEYVQLTNFGKQNTDHYGIGYYYTSADNRNLATSVNRVVGCAFDSGYNIGINVVGTNGMKMDSNIIYGNWAGGIDVDVSATNTTVTNNVVIGSRQRPSILAGGYPWTVPMAAFLFRSDKFFTASGNIAAGSFDEGFGVASGLLSLFPVGSVGANAVCGLTWGETYNNPASYLSNNRHLYNNEAVGCRSGFTIFTLPGSNVNRKDCIVVSGVKVWRSGHVGLEGVDLLADFLIHDVVLAENPVGTSFSYFKVGVENAFTGLIDSTIIGTFSVNGYSDSLDSPLSKQTCQAFTFTDPWGLQDDTCGSVISPHYRRVGLLLPQHTNGPKTCATAGRFTCRPPNVPDRLCGMPWDNRFGVPVSMLYSEMHIHNVRFIGFRAGPDVPSSNYRSAAIAINPSQTDAQSTLIVSGLSWAAPGDAGGESVRMDEMARIGVEHGDTLCNGHWCMGLEMLIVHDQDGSFAKTDGLPSYTGGQLSLGNGVMTAPAPMCFSASHLGPNWQLCPSAINDRDDDVFRQYSAVWRDWGADVIGPVTTTRYFGSNDNRTFPSYEPKDDMCALKLSYSRFPLLIASGGRLQRIESVGTIPSMWSIRWDAPSVDDVAILEFWIHEGGHGGSSVINVLTSSSSDGPWTKVNNFADRYPNSNDPAGSNTRNPQKRTLTVVLRGGPVKFYRFAVQPVVAVTMRMEMTLQNFFADKFIVNLATLLKVSIDRIAIADVRQGSVIVDFTVAASSTPTDPSDFAGQIEELNALNALLNSSLASGNLSRAVNATILDFAADVPPTPVFFNEEGNVEPPTLAPTPTPTRKPTATPTHAPTRPPTHFPTQEPTFTPTVFSSDAILPSDDDSVPIYEESYFLPAVIAAGVLLIVTTFVLMGYYCGFFGGCFGLFANSTGKERALDATQSSGPRVIVGSGARTRRVSPPQAVQALTSAPVASKRVVPTASGNRMPAHATRNLDNVEAQNLTGEGLFVSNQNEMTRNDSLQKYSSPSRAKPGVHHHQLSGASDGTSMSFDEKPADVIRHTENNTFHLDNPVEDEEVELYFDYGTQL